MSAGVWLPLGCVGLPALTALVLALVPLRRGAVVVLANAAVLAAFALALAMGAGPRGDLRLGTWLAVPPLAVPLGFQVDGLSVTFALVVTGVGFLIHAYSAGYMAHDRDLQRYFAGLNAFVAAMLLLVLADGPVLLLIGWAGVGFASYLLIGFWYERPVAVAAARKAFLVNVVGDVGLMLAVAVLVGATGALDYGDVFARLGTLGPGAAAAAVWLLFVGAAAKSAQLPMHTWLPDAMEGPTPVSALIHAATMVTAGVYLLVRVQPLLQAAPGAAEGIAVLGGAGCLLAAAMGLAQRDIKRVLAYSTMSQVAYMFMGAAAGVTDAAVSHVMTHAFFKALLFMGAGVVMHALGGEERDLYRMGGLRRRLPFTAAAMGIGCLAIAGFPGLSGFFSKDALLEGLLTHGHPLLWATGVAVAGLTAFYMFRLYFLTFWGPERGAPAGHGREAPAAMLWPMAVLAVLSVAGGILVRPLPAFSATSLLTLLCGLVGFGLAWRLYARRGPVGDAWLQGSLGAVLRGEFGFDAAYRALIVRPGEALAAACAAVDRRLWRGLGAAVVAVGAGAASGLRRWQSGLVRRYALSILVGAAAALLWAGWLAGR
jgi:NADH-quinone oxidoreductase subunit L